jgi:carbon storage regulator
MLVLSRKYGQKIIIDGGITITVVEIAGGHVRLGIDAPPGVTIDRSEVAAAKAAGITRNQQQRETL